MNKTDGIQKRPPLRVSIKLFLAAVAAAVGVAGLAGVVLAHTVTISSQHAVSFTPDVATDLFAGQVSSAKAACARGRSIVLYRVIGDSSVPDQEVTTATTDPGGVWSKGAGQARAGEYSAVAARKVIRSPGHKHVCKAARSATLSVSPVLEGLSLDPDTVEVGQSSTGTVSLSVIAQEDLMVSLESSDASVGQVPATVTVSAGQDRVSFPITTTTVGSTTIAASLNGTSFTQTLVVASTEQGLSPRS